MDPILMSIQSLKWISAMVQNNILSSIDGINSWNVQIWNSVDLTSWQGKNILNTYAILSFASPHAESHLGHFGFMSPFLWYLILPLLMCISLDENDLHEKQSILHLTGMCSRYNIRSNRIAIPECHWLQSDINKMAI